MEEGDRNGCKRDDDKVKEQKELTEQHAYQRMKRRKEARAEEKRSVIRATQPQQI